MNRKFGLCIPVVTGFLNRRLSVVRHLLLRWAAALAVLFSILGPWQGSTQVARAHNGNTVTVPVVTTAPPFDGTCDISNSPGFDGAAKVTITDNVSAYVERTDSDLYICFIGIDFRPSETPPQSSDWAIVNIDNSHDGGATIGPDDYEFAISRTDTTSVSAIAGSGRQYCLLGGCYWSYTGFDPGGWSATGRDVYYPEFFVNWHAELRISKATLGGNWFHTVGFNVSYEEGNGPVYYPPGASSDTEPNGWLDLNLNGGSSPLITAVNPTSGKTPQAVRPGSLVYLRGYNLCANSPVVFFFGPNGPSILSQPLINYEMATPDPATQCHPGGVDDLAVRVPRLALTGPISLYQTHGSTDTHIWSGPYSWSGTFDVQSFRSQNGFAFENFNGPRTLDLSDYVDVFGWEAFAVTINICWLWGQDCSVPIGPDPSAFVFYGISKQLLEGNGLCFGIALGSQRLLRGDKPFSAFPPPGATTVWQLADSGSPSPSLEHYLNLQHLYQNSVQFITAWVQGAAANLQPGAASILFNDLKGALSANPPDYRLISLSNGKSGHAVLAYDVELGTPANGGNGDGDYFIYVYDPNQPFDDEGIQYLETVVSIHAQHEITTGTIHVFANNTWRFDGFDPYWSGGLDRLVATRYSVTPTGHPTLPTLSNINIDWLVALGNVQTTQITDAAGHTLLMPDGSINVDPNTRVPNATRYVDLSGNASIDSFIMQSATPFTQTLVGTATGVYSATTFAPGLVASIQDVATSLGGNDQLAFDAGSSSLKFQTQAAQKAVVEQLIGRANDASQRTATLTAISFQGGGDALSFDTARNTVTYKHSGQGTNASLVLAWMGTNGMPATFRSGPLNLRPGDSLSITPSNWTNLLTSSFAVTTTHSDGTHDLQTWTQTAPIRLIGGDHVYPPGTATVQVTAKAMTTISGTIPLASVQATSNFSGTWQTLATLSGTGPVTVTAAFNVTSPTYGGSNAPGLKTFFVRVLDTNNDTVLISALSVTYQTDHLIYLPVIGR